MDVDKPAVDANKPKEPEPDVTVLQNPSRVLPSQVCVVFVWCCVKLQLKKISFETSSRFRPAAKVICFFSCFFDIVVVPCWWYCCCGGRGRRG